jgi:hypothetical protein
MKDSSRQNYDNQLNLEVWLFCVDIFINSNTRFAINMMSRGYLLICF